MAHALRGNNQRIRFRGRHWFMVTEALRLAQDGVEVHKGKEAEVVCQEEAHSNPEIS